ncbi:MAG: long-chain-acyl-CoA synthetase [Pseudomonadales bacterium]|nr:long-chain-acyl-CoA synthetase [Pseudomonadales bacterium]
MGAISEFLGDLKVLYTAATVKPPASDTKRSLPVLVEEHAVNRPDEIALLHEGSQVTWRELNERANRVARALEARGIGRGDCVSLFMQNRIEFVETMLGICKLGAVAGLINTNLTRHPLVHCINLIDSKVCVFGEEQVEALNEVRDELSLADGSDYLFVRDAGVDPVPNWAIELDSTDTTINDDNLPITSEIEMRETAWYVFTSGTTGLPKAAVISHKRIVPTGMMMADLLLRIDSNDRMYNCLPLYHATGLMVGLGAAFHAGASTVIRRKLSVQAFWDDIRKYNCTSFVYIGEFIRYLMSVEEKSTDKDNPVRTIVGNGLRPDIWMDFKRRFDIERIGEFYGASEGNGGFANVFNKDCTVGLGIAPVTLIKYDVASDEIIRNEDGLCEEVADGEPGLLLIKVTEKSQFEGYTSKEATSKKLVKNVLEEGDEYFNTGDVMKTVDVGFTFGQKHYQFVDRIGDTFRWKSENVATNEVSEIINRFPGIIFSNVYGVEIPGTDGRAGMAAIVFREGVDVNDFDMEGFSQHVRDNLPSYARPIYLRILKELPTTTTHKLQKNDLRDQAFHLDKVPDQLFVMKPGDNSYTGLDSDFYDKIISREVSF